ncbi:hypothetical protein O181_036962 [Austropuccinia psidii MF-1]|uniref:Uncharacterized protein n=1 Tax=Austropuccinia psidii MF-1 TaxID=1389203 RepID=A0A9Q3HAF3_9BASI|nr:hypothetical protein [Austropuccinia psidii MF-1]
MPTTRQLPSIVGVLVLTAGLVKEQRWVTKLKQAQGKIPPREAEKVLAAAVAAINAEPLPTAKEGRENYFMEQVGTGKTLASSNFVETIMSAFRGLRSYKNDHFFTSLIGMPQGAMPAAIAFLKAYKVYPLPQELMMIYQRTMPPEVFAILVEMIKQDFNQMISAAKTSASTSREEPGGKALKDNVSKS